MNEYNREKPHKTLIQLKKISINKALAQLTIKLCEKNINYNKTKMIFPNLFLKSSNLHF